jgi:hypothetical protein
VKKPRTKRGEVRLNQRSVKCVASEVSHVMRHRHSRGWSRSGLDVIAISRRLGRGEPSTTLASR